MLSSPGRPKWTFQRSPARFCSRVEGAWSVEMWVRVPARSSRHICGLVLVQYVPERAG